MSEEKQSKGGKKGGSYFPRVNLKQCVEYAIKLVSKTHTGPQPESIIYPGVFGAKSWRGGVRASALKQFGLLKGNKKGFDATTLAKNIVAAPIDERKQLLEKACFKSKIIKHIYDTFFNDAVALSKVRQQVLNFQVHPENADECASIIVESLEYAGLAKTENNQILFAMFTETVDKSDELAEEQINDFEDTNGSEGLDNKNGDSNKSTFNMNKVSGRANVQINIDPSMDPEKLEKLLSVLKKFGQI